VVLEYWAAQHWLVIKWLVIKVDAEKRSFFFSFSVLELPEAGHRPGPGGVGSALLGVGLHGLLLAFPTTQVLACIIVGHFGCSITLAYMAENGLHHCWSFWLLHHPCLHGRKCVLC